MKSKLLIIVLLILIIVFGFARINYQDHNRIRPGITGAVAPTAKTEKPAVILVIDDGQSVATFSGVAASTAFDALLWATYNKQMEIETKKYDFGTMVTKFDGKVSGSDMAWIYFINGKSGEVAADKAKVKNGDTVEWRYMKPAF
jgi:hypothetical protein